MTKIKFCGLRRDLDIEYANELLPDCIGFVFWEKSKRYVTPADAKKLKAKLSPAVKAVGVFVDEDVRRVAHLLNTDVIDAAQLHGGEDEAYIAALKALSPRPVIKAFRVASSADVRKAEASSADMILLDNGKGTGEVFDWTYLNDAARPFMLAGGLSAENAAQAIKRFHPYAVDLSSAIETDGVKDKMKMTEFLKIVRNLKD